MIREGDVVRWPYGAAETAPVDERDIAAVAARALYEDGHAGGDYVLTGPESLSQAEQVSMIGEAIGRQIRFEELSPEEFRRETAGSWPGPVVDMLLAAWGATIGRPAFVTSTVADVVGSPARTFRQWVADHAGRVSRRPGELNLETGDWSPEPGARDREPGARTELSIPSRRCARASSARGAACSTGSRRTTPRDRSSSCPRRASPRGGCRTRRCPLRMAAASGRS